MFNFTTQTIFNSIVKATEAQVRNKTAPKGYNIITKTGANGPELRIGNTRFNQANIVDIQIKNHSVENLAEVTFDMSALGTLAEGAESPTFEDGIYRIVIYIGLSMNSQDSFYTNDFVYKGKPLFIEFPVKAGDSADTIAKRVIKIANKYMLFVAQEKILDITESSGNVTIKGVNGYQQIKKAILQKYDPEAIKIDCCSTGGDYVDLITGVPAIWTADPTTGEITVTASKTLDSEGIRDLADNEVTIAPGIEAFGDYNWIIHNLRLPTLANTYFWAATKSEMPIVGGNYTQFIIRVCAERDGIGGEVVGQRATSVTTHVLYVLDQGNNVNLVKTELANLKAASTDADTALSDPFAGLQ